MNYSGKLYGKVGKTYIPLVLTSEDVDRMKPELAEAREQIGTYQLELVQRAELIQERTKERDEFAKRLRETAAQMIEARTERDDSTKQRDSLAEALGKISNGTYSASGARVIAETALAAVKGGTP